MVKSCQSSVDTPRWGIPLSAFPNGTTSKLAGLFFTLSLYCWASCRVAVNTYFKVIGLTRLWIKLKSTAPEADAFTTQPSELFNYYVILTFEHLVRPSSKCLWHIFLNCFANNSYVIVQLSVLLIYKFLSVQNYFLSRNKIILYTMYSQLLWHNGTVFT